ncbi:MAG: AarF/ABC1/UbiB kinase family protein [Bacteriovoracaceae bacterium]|nr:AarF/ABC1/UbiB kinase family protein [Bacteriovoracaceae bacterium]
MDIPQSKWARGSKLLKMASKMAAQEIGHRLPGAMDQAKKLAARIEQTRLLVETLSQMKGAAMKAGQLLGLEAGEYLPPEVVEILSKLQSSGSSLSIEKIEEILKSELKEKYSSLQHVSQTSVASASIGQVHTAQYNDRTIALKVQFPGISQTIDSDVAMLESLVTKLQFFTDKKIELSPLFEEIRNTLHQEADYTAELDFMEQYSKNFKNKNGFVIPSPIREISTNKVLAMDYIKAQSLKDWTLTASKEDKQFIGTQMMELFLHEYLECGLVQTDPNWGNFLVTDKCELVVLDFGACKVYDEEFRKTYRSILDLTMRREKAELLKISEGFGLIDPRESQDAKDSYLHMMDVVIAPFRHQGDFDFSKETYSKNSKDASIAFAKMLKFSPPPKNLIFLHRKLGGVFQTMKKLETTMDLRLVWQRMV